MRLLLVEDDRTLGASLQKALENNAYGVDWVPDGEAAVLYAENSSFLAIVLDLNIPKLSGLDVIRTLRAKGDDIPILVLTARDSSTEKVEGLDCGADDYVVKPFDLDELLARLRSVIRRRDRRNDTVLRCRGGVEIDPSSKTVRKNGESVIVTANEFRVLKMLAERAGRYVSKPDIEYALYDAANAVESNAVEVIVYKLRRKLGNDFIKTMRGVGYMVFS